jgi:hypothetical protein
MSTTDANYPWQVHLFGDGLSTRQGVLVLMSYPILLVLVILSAFIRYMWVALATYCTLMFVLHPRLRRAGAPRSGGAVGVDYYLSIAMRFD